MHLRDLLRCYGMQRDVSKDTLTWLKMVVGRLERNLARPATEADLSDEIVNGWVQAMLSEGRLSRQTVYSYRRGLLILWRFAVEERIVDSGPARLRRIKLTTILPEAWTVAEVASLASAAEKIGGRLRSGFDRSRVAAALILTAWDSGLRLSDLLRLRFADIDSSGCGVILQHKTGNPVAFRLRTPTLNALSAIRTPDREFIFGDILPKKSAYDAMRAAVKGAGLPAGGTKRIRKSGATAVEQHQPGAAMAYLGHLTPGLAHKHYVDPRLVQKLKVSPPQLPETG